MKATLFFYDLQRIKDITAFYIEKTLGLSVERVDLDKLVVELNEYNVKDFERSMNTYRDYGFGGIIKIDYKD